jgi:hypothetical protein
MAGQGAVTGEEAAIGDTKVAAESHKAPGTGFSEEGDSEDAGFYWSADEEDAHDDRPDDAILSKAEFQLVLDRASAKFGRFVGRLRARNGSVLIKDYTAADDFADSDDEEVVRVHA